MPQSELRLVKRFIEYVAKADIGQFVPPRCRGIYVLFRRRKVRRSGERKTKHDVVYVGMAAAGRRSGIRGRLMTHRKKKGDEWTHFSAFEVWDNIRDEEVVELEGLFRHIYRNDTAANRLNVQGGFKKLKRIKLRSLKSGDE
jgi:hypothetical protein